MYDFDSEIIIVARGQEPGSNENSDMVYLDLRTDMMKSLVQVDGTRACNNKASKSDTLTASSTPVLCSEAIFKPGKVTWDN